MDEDIGLFSGFLNEIIGKIEVLVNRVIFPILSRNVEIMRNVFFFMVNKAASGHWEDSLDA